MGDIDGNAKKRFVSLVFYITGLVPDEIEKYIKIARTDFPYDPFSGIQIPMDEINPARVSNVLKALDLEPPTRGVVT